MQGIDKIGGSSRLASIRDPAAAMSGVKARALATQSNATQSMATQSIVARSSMKDANSRYPPRPLFYPQRHRRSIGRKPPQMAD